MQTRSRVAAIPLLAGLVLLCSATRAQVSDFVFSVRRLNRKIVRVDVVFLNASSFLLISPRPHRQLAPSSVISFVLGDGGSRVASSGEI